MIHVLLTPLLLVQTGVAPPSPQGTTAQSAWKGNATERLVRALPSESIGVLATAGMDQVRQRFDQNAWAAFASEGTWDGIEDALTMALGSEGKALAAVLDLEAILDSIQGPMAGGVSISAYGWEGCFLVDAGQDAEAFDALFQIAWKEIVNSEETSATHEYDGATILVVKSEGQDGNLGLFQDRGIYGALLHQDPESVLKRVVELIDRVRGHVDDEGFLGTHAFEQAREAHAGTPALRLVFNGASFFQALSKELDDDQLGHTTELGVFDIDWGYASMDLGAGESLDFHSGISIPKDTLLGDFADLLGPVPTHLISRLPAESTNISLGNYDVSAAWQLFLDTIANYSPEGFEEIRGGLSQARDLWDIDVEEDVISQFTGNFASFTMPIPEGEFDAQLEVLGIAAENAINESNAFMIELDDPYVVEGVVEQALLITGVGSMVEETDFQGYTFQTAHLGIQSMMWGFTDDTLIYSTTPTPMHTALTLADRTEVEKSHLSRFRDVMKRHGSNVSFITVSDTRSTVETTLSALGLLEQILPMMEVDPSLRAMMDLGLPDRSLVGSYFQGTMVQTVARRGDGVYVTLEAR